MKRLTYNIISILMMLTFVIFLFVKNVSVESVPVVTVPGSYGEQFAKENGLHQASLPDSLKDETDLRYTSDNDIPFEYDEEDNGIILKYYSGENDVLIIPAYIEDKPVTGIDFNLLGPYSLVVIPETVTSITGTASTAVFDPAFAVELIFTIIAFFAVLLVLNLKLHKLKDASEVVLTGPQIFISFFYFAVQIVFALLVIYKGIASALLSFLISSLMLGFYICFVMMASQGRRHAVKVEQELRTKTVWIDEVRIKAGNLTQGISDRTLRVQVQQVVDELRYSPPSSSPSSLEYETIVSNELDTLVDILKTGDRDEAIKQCSIVINSIRERNIRTKNARSSRN